MASIVVKSPIRRQSSRATGQDRDPSALKPRRSPEREQVTQLSLSLGKCSLNNTDSQILSLIQHVPRKKTPSHCLENFYLYLPALKIYNAVTDNKPSDEDVGLPDKAIRRKVYQLVFDTLYHYEVLQELLVESSFFSRNFHTHSDESLLHLMLFDLQSSKFNLRLKANEAGSVPEAVAKMADALWNHRTKLNATLARMRVEGRALKIHQLIPDSGSRRKYECSNQYLCYARVNTIKVQDVQTQVVDKLLQDGFVQVDSGGSLTQKKSMHLLEDDLLVFSSDCRGQLDELSLVDNGCLVLQDVTSYEFVDGIRKKIEACSGDVIVTEPNSGVEVAHIATLLDYRGTVIVYNTQSTDTSLIRENLSSLEIRNVKFLDMPFVCTSSEDDLFEDVQIIVCLSTTPPSSQGNLVDYALQEGDCNRLKALLLPSKKQENRSEEDKTILINSLANALTFNQVEHIFMKLSQGDKKQDMEAIVSETLEEYNGKAEKTGMKNFIISFPHNQDSDDSSDEENTGFSIVIQREPDKPPTPPRRVIDRAIANGVIDGEGISDETVCIIKKKRRKSKPTLGSIPMMTFAAQQKVVKKKEPTNNKIFRI